MPCWSEVLLRFPDIIHNIQQTLNPLLRLEILIVDGFGPVYGQRHFTSLLVSHTRHSNSRYRWIWRSVVLTQTRHLHDNIAISASCEHLFFRVNENLVQHQSNIITISKVNSYAYTTNIFRQVIIWAMISRRVATWKIFTISCKLLWILRFLKYLLKIVYYIFYYSWEPVLIRRILIGFEAILK